MNSNIFQQAIDENRDVAKAAIKQEIANIDKQIEQMKAGFDANSATEASKQSFENRKSTLKDRKDALRTRLSESEEINELDKKTLQSYHGKAATIVGRFKHTDRRDEMDPKIVAKREKGLKVVRKKLGYDKTDEEILNNKEDKDMNEGIGQGASIIGWKAEFEAKLKKRGISHTKIDWSFADHFRNNKYSPEDAAEKYVKLFEGTETYSSYTFNTRKKNDEYEWSVSGISHGRPMFKLEQGTAKTRPQAISAAKKVLMRYRGAAGKTNEDVTLSESSTDLKTSYEKKAKDQVKELTPWTKKGEYQDIAKRMVDRRKKGLDRLNRMKNEDVDLDESDGKNGYVAFYKGKRTEVYANTTYEAQKKAAEFFKAKKSYEVTVKLAEKDGKQVTHTMVDSVETDGVVVVEKEDRELQAKKLAQMKAFHAAARKRREEKKSMEMKAVNDCTELDEGKISSVDAKEILAANGGVDADFHELRSSHVDGLLTAAKKYGYKKSAGAAGSKGRMFHEYLSRLVSSGKKTNEEVELDEAKKQYKTKTGLTQWKQSYKTLEKAAREGNTGFCLACGSRNSGVEPDARKYTCQKCGKDKVYGAEELVLMGLTY